MSFPVILIADDHVIIRRGLTFLLNTYIGKFEITEVEAAGEIIPELQKKSFTHLILDMQLQDANIIEVFGDIKKLMPTVKIMIYTMSPEDIFGKRMIQLGADVFLSKQSHEEEVLKVLKLFINGNKYISQNLQDLIEAQKSTRTVHHNSPFEQLSTRETEVLIRLLQGQGVKEISNELDINISTAATFKARLFDKLGVSSFIDLQNLAKLYNL